ncbi:MAG: SAM-dependent chlorinase/fluorinase [Candidatus Peregrinibacteria bacterium]
MHPLISLSTDFGLNKGIGIMKACILDICPDAVIIDLAHNIQSFDITDGARLFESVAYVRKGEHVCVVDPGVGTKRQGLIIETGRGDHLIGPDNGVLIPATRFLGGIRRAHRITTRN